MCRWLTTVGVALAILGASASTAVGATPTGCEVPDIKGEPLRQAAAYAGDTDKVAVTFDEHLGPNTEAILDTFAASGMTGTFYQVGRDIRDHRAKARRIVADGHELGNHSWSHADQTALTSREIFEDLRSANRAAERVTGFRPCTFRPPGLRWNRTEARQVARLDLEPIGATRGNDVFVADPAAICANALEAIMPGDIILMHQVPGSVEALPCILRGIRERGLRSVPVVKLLGGEFNR